MNQRKNYNPLNSDEGEEIVNIKTASPLSKNMKREPSNSQEQKESQIEE